MAEARQVNDLGLPIGLPMTIYRVANTSIMRAWYQIGRLDAVKEHGFNEVFKFVRDLAIDGLPSRDDEAMQDALDRQFLLFERLVRSLVAQHRLLERSVSNGAGTGTSVCPNTGCSRHGREEITRRNFPKYTLLTIFANIQCVSQASRTSLRKLSSRCLRKLLRCLRKFLRCLRCEASSLPFLAGHSLSPTIRLRSLLLKPVMLSIQYVSRWKKIKPQS